MWKNLDTPRLDNVEMDYVHDLHQYLHVVIICFVCKTREDRGTVEQAQQVFRDCPRCTLLNHA